MIKKILFSILLIPISLCGQSIALNEIDEFTDARIIKVNAAKNSKWRQGDDIAVGFFDNIYLSTRFIEGNPHTITLIFNLQMGATVCLSEYDGQVILLFEDKSKMQMKQISRTDCSGSVDGYFIAGETFEEQLINVQKLSKSKVDKVRFHTPDGYIDREIIDTKKEVIQETFALLLKTIKEEGFIQ